VKILDMTGRSETVLTQVEWGVSYEYLVSLCAFGLPDAESTLESGPDWFEKTRTKMSPTLSDAIRAIGERAGKTWVNFVGLATKPPAARSVRSLIARIQALSAMEVRLYLLGYHVPAYQGSISRDVLLRAAEGDREAKARLLSDRSYYSGEADPALRPLLALSAPETKEIALEVLDRWYDEVFSEQEAELRPVLERDAESKRAMLSGVPPDRLIEIASGIEFVAQPGIHQVFLIPQLAMRPWVLLCEHDDARLFCYPVVDESLGEDRGGPPSRLVRLHKALGDERRLRMLKAVASQSATLQELADRFGLPKSTAHHHLAILRASGLVRMTSDLERRYSVRHDVLPEVSDLLEAYLTKGAER
jgi:DNA-binding transcriptional ArsR family regulator